MLHLVHNFLTIGDRAQNVVRRAAHLLLEPASNLGLGAAVKHCAVPCYVGLVTRPSKRFRLIRCDPPGPVAVFAVAAALLALSAAALSAAALSAAALSVVAAEAASAVPGGVAAVAEGGVGSAAKASDPIPMHKHNNKAFVGLI